LPPPADQGSTMQVAILNDILIIFALSIGVLLSCHRLRIPGMVGLLLTGILAGPHGFKLVQAVHEVEILSEIGVILLLFAIGIEFSLQRLSRIKIPVLAGGSLQVGLTTLVIMIVVRPFHPARGESLFIGFLVALSSTAIVLKLLQERGEVDSPHGNMALAVLIFQDVIIVPMMLFIPILAGETQSIPTALGVLILKGVGIILLVMIGARVLVPRLLHLVARTRITELFLTTVLVICLAVVWITANLGLSIALGAFLAGLIVSESEYSHHALGNVIPFRDVFTSFFFVSIGMLLDLRFCLEAPLVIAGITLAVFFVKAVVGSLVTLIIGLPLRTAILSGLSVSQLGEFSFILARTGTHYGFLKGDSYQIFLAVAILTMAATPLIMQNATKAADWILKLPFPGRLKSRCVSCSIENRYQTSQGHLIIVGFGLTGRHIAQAARLAGIPYLIVGMNAQRVREKRAKGEPIFYGDASQETVLLHANIRTADTLVVAINDPAAVRRITVLARRLNPKIYIIVRTRYVIEMDVLYQLGADEVIPEEYETSVEIFTRVLAQHHIPGDVIDQYVDEIRSSGYRMFRGRPE